MSLSDLASLSTALSGIIVTASLIYLALQTHQNAKHTKALIQQGRTDRAVSALMAWATTDLTKAWLVRNGEAPTPDAIYRRQTSLMFECLLRGSIDSFAQHADGLLSEEQFGEQCAAVEQTSRLATFREYWREWSEERRNQTPAFIAFVDSLVARGASAERHSSSSVYGTRPSSETNSSG
jgi:hypothetical protein